VKQTLARWSLVALVTGSTLPPSASAQEVEVIGPVQPTIFAGDLRLLQRASEWRPGDPIREIPRRYTMRGEPPQPAPRRVALDPLLAVQSRTLQRDSATFGAPSLNFAGQGFTGLNPPDTVGDVGRTFYIQMINANGGARFMIYTKLGNPVAGPIQLDSLAASPPCSSGLGDPVVLYDPLAGRWLLSEFSSTANALCVYVSRTEDPVVGGWYAYAFTTPDFPDYPKYAVWHDAYYVTSNEGGASPVYALERGQMLLGGAATAQRVTTPLMAGFGFQALTPADLDGLSGPPAGAPAYIARHRDDEAHNPPGTPVDFVDLWELEVDWATPGNTTLTQLPSIELAEFDSALCGLSSFNCFPQPGTSTTLDPLREVVMWRLSYRNSASHETLLGNMVTDVDGNDRGGIRWFELRKVAGGPWTLYQEGTYSPDAVNRWMGSIAMDHANNIAVVYNVSSASVFPGLRYAGRQAIDPLGTLPRGEHVLVDGTASNGSNRYGDYAALSVDPVDDCTFWFTGEYNVASTWSTRIGRFRFENCGVQELFIAEGGAGGERREAATDAPAKP